MRPGYGYAGIPDPNYDILAPENTGIYRLNLADDRDGSHAEQLISIAEVAAHPHPHGDLRKAKHYFNHLLFNSDGSRFIFLHRWRLGDKGFQTRMMTAASDGTDLYVVDGYGKMSHFIWKDTGTILAWSWQPSDESAFYIYKDKTNEVTAIGKDSMTLNGHCSYLRNSDWILNDCYPQGGERSQELYVYYVPADRRIDLGSFYSPPEYTGEWRCDLHPRSNPAGRYITFDSPHGGDGRQIYLQDIREVVGGGSNISR